LLIHASLSTSVRARFIPARKEMEYHLSRKISKEFCSFSGAKWKASDFGLLRPKGGVAQEAGHSRSITANDLEKQQKSSR